jgi:hypothetical protein
MAEDHLSAPGSQEKHQIIAELQVKTSTKDASPNINQVNRYEVFAANSKNVASFKPTHNGP